MIFIKKVSYFKLTNAIMSIACFGFFAISSGFCNVHILDSNKATSNIRGNNFEFSSNDKVFSMRKNGELAGLAITDNGVKFRNSLTTLQCNGIAVIGAVAVGTMAAGAAFATTVEGAAVGAAAVAGEAIPGAAAVAATLGGAGEVAAEAAAVGAGVALAEAGTALLVGAVTGLVIA